MNLDHLAELCERATPGKRVAEVDLFDNGEWEAVVSNEGTTMLFTSGTDVPMYKGDDKNWTAEDSRLRDEQCRKAKESQAMHDARFMAACDRETVLALLRVVRAAKAYVQAEQCGSGYASWTAERDMLNALDALGAP